MENFVTLFNKDFLPQGMALHKSMQRHIKQYILWILCVDDQTYDILKSLKLENVRLLQLSFFETEKLRAIKKTRTLGEYCWTLTPFTPRFVFDTDKTIGRVTYLDADIWFMKDPKPIFDEFEKSGKHVLITEHAYAPEYDQTSTSGRFCVQFITFTRSCGEKIRSEWEKQCVDWCYARFEGDKFGDQKYLDSWPHRHADSVHILEEKGSALAPWNSIVFPQTDAIFFHFHGLRIVSRNWLIIGQYRIPFLVRKNIYKPYTLDLKSCVDELERNHFILKKHSVLSSLPRQLFKFLRQIYRNYKNLSSLGYMKW